MKNHYILESENSDLTPLSSKRHKYNTRSSLSGIDNSLETYFEASMPPRVRQVACGEENPRKSLFRRILKPLKITLFIGLIAIATKYVSDHTYNSLHSDLTQLRHNLQDMQKDLRIVANKKTDLEKQLVDISNALPDLKRMAHEVQKGMKNLNTKQCSTDHLKNAIREELDIFNADKTGKTDFALESSGGSIVSTRDTESLNKEPSFLTMFGIPLCHVTNGPQALIQSGMMPGECWAFKGTCGNAVIKLITKIFITGVSLEHISPSISPTGEIKTAPKEFSIWGLENSEQDGFFFGKFTYSLKGPLIQYFSVVHKAPKMYENVEFKVHSNHGNPEYTCVYRLRVHGDLEMK